MEDKTAEIFHGVHLLADRDTCQSKCNVTIYTPGQLMNSRHTHRLHAINVIVGNKSATNNICQSYRAASHLNINCSSWKHGKNVKQAVNKKFA